MIITIVSFIIIVLYAIKKKLAKLNFIIVYEDKEIEVEVKSNIKVSDLLKYLRIKLKIDDRIKLKLFSERYISDNAILHYNKFHGSKLILIQLENYDHNKSNKNKMEANHKCNIINRNLKTESSDTFTITNQNSQFNQTDHFNVTNQFNKYNTISTETSMIDLIKQVTNAPKNMEITEEKSKELDEHITLETILNLLNLNTNLSSELREQLITVLRNRQREAEENNEDDVNIENSEDNNNNNETIQTIPNQDMLNQLKEMGFDEIRCRKVLIYTNNNINTSTELLLNDQDLDIPDL